MSSHLLEQVLLVVAGAVVPALFGWLRGYRRRLIAVGERKQKEADRDAALALETKERGKLEQRVEELEKDINNVAEGNRILYRGLEKRVAAIDKQGSNLETLVTGKMPRVRTSGESEAAK